MMSKKKDFIGRLMAGREALTAPDRQVVVGIKPLDQKRRLRSGAHVVPKGAIPGPQTDQGYVTSVCYSPMMEQWIGLGLVERGRERFGEIVRIHDPLRGEDYEAEICNPVFYDPEGARQRG
jgi:glycine cleavage system aminomethyltransferase T